MVSSTKGGVSSARHRQDGGVNEKGVTTTRVRYYKQQWFNIPKGGGEKMQLDPSEQNVRNTVI